MVKIDSEVIAEVRNALQIIMGNAELIISMYGYSANKPGEIKKQAKRIDSLLPGKI